MIETRPARTSVRMARRLSGSCRLRGDCATTQSPTGRNPPTDRPAHNRIFPTQPKLFCFMADHQEFACTQRVFHLFRTDFDFQCLAAVGHRKPKYRVFLRCTTWPE